jgi:hypothetical protein
MNNKYLSYLCLGMAFVFLLFIMFGCANFQPRKVCTMDEWIVTSDCP